MAPRPIAQTTAWVAQVVSDKDGVEGVEQLSDRSIKISRRKYPPYRAGIISAYDVTDADVRAVLSVDAEVDILVNVPAQGIWQGTAIAAAADAGRAFGGMGDLYSCIGEEDPRTHVRPEFHFIERGLRQHNRVSEIVREADRLFLLKRTGDLPDLPVLALYEYELTAEHLRTARERYGDYSLVLISNPNGQPTQGARDLAQAMGVEFHMFGSLLGRLNRP